MIAVLGIGGVGGLIAVRTGAICVASERTGAVLAERGLTLVQGSCTTSVRLPVVSMLERRISLLVIAVKAPSLERALARVAPSSIDSAVVLPLLNGLEHMDVIRQRFEGSGATIVAGSIGRLEAFSPEAGLVVQRTPGALITAASSTLSLEALRAALAPLDVPGIDLAFGESERAVIWEKAARLAVLAAGTVAAARPIGLLRDDEVWRERLVVALHEACSVANADGTVLVPTEQLAIIDAMPYALTSSASRDVAAGRPSELDAITGSVIRAGARLGVATPELERLLEDACRQL